MPKNNNKPKNLKETESGSIQVNNFVSLYFYTFLGAFVGLFTNLLRIITLNLYKPKWELSYAFWYSYRMAKRKG